MALIEVITAYLGPAASINHAAYMTLDVAHATPVTALHYDRKPAVKAFLCITAANAAHGAPAFVPAATNMARRYARLTSPLVSQKANCRSHQSMKTGRPSLWIVQLEA